MIHPQRTSNCRASLFSYNGANNDLHDWGSREHCFPLFEGLTLNIKTRYQWNWAHTFFDGLYPAYVALAKFNRHREPYMTFLDSHMWEPDTLSECPECAEPPRTPYARLGLSASSVFPSSLSCCERIC
eukprot:236399-Amphidinium_carterae.1